MEFLIGVHNHARRRRERTTAEDVPAEGNGAVFAPFVLGHERYERVQETIPVVARLRVAEKFVDQSQVTVADRIRCAIELSFCSKTIG